MPFLPLKQSQANMFLPPVSSIRRAMAPPQTTPLQWPCLEACSSPASVPVLLTPVPWWHPQDKPCAGVTMEMAN